MNCERFGPAARVDPGRREAVAYPVRGQPATAGRCGQQAVIPGAGVGVDDLDVANPRTEVGGERAIDLERDDAAGAARELARERALARADLHHEVALGRGDDIDDGAGNT